MILQRSHHVTDCPICGRPVEIQSQHIGHEIACGHCRGQFVIYETDDGLTAAKLEGWGSVERAEQLLQGCGRSSRSASSDRCKRLFNLLAVLDDEERSLGRHDTTLETDVDESEEPPTALLVEHRDEVFARIATDMAESGLCVVRAKSATEALKLCGVYEPALVVANIDLPEQSGWLLAGKLRFVDQRIRVWLYQSETTSYDEGMADYLRVDQLVEYGGDLLGLSETIIEQMAGRRRPHEAASSVGTTGELAGA